MNLYLLQVHSKTLPKVTETYLERFPSFAEACKSVIKRAKENNCFCAQIDEKLAKKKYKKITIKD